MTLCPSPSGCRVAAIRRDACYFFVLDESVQQWRGPVRVQEDLTSREMGDPWPPYGWSTDKDSKTEFFVLNNRRLKGVRFVDGHPVIIDLKEAVQLADTTSPRKQTPLDDSWLEWDADSPTIRNSPSSGKKVEFPIHERPAPEAGRDVGTFSPDGKWVLMRYSYGPDEHHAGGYLQLFDREGRFAFEIAKFAEDTYSPTGEAHWLHNNWIVYYDGRNAVFTKFLNG